MLGERARAECENEKKTKNEEEAEQRRGARTSKKSEGGVQNCKKMCARRVARVPLKKMKNLQKIVRAARGAITSKKSEGGAPKISKNVRGCTYRKY